MPTAFDQLLEATIQHVEQLKAHGNRYVTVSPEVLKSLAQPVARTAQSSPASRPSPSKISSPTIEAKSDTSKAMTISSPEISTRPVTTISAEAKAAALAELQQRVLSCVKCAHLVASRKNIVLGVGNTDADVMFVGEAPGADEDEQGEPFVGRAGELLTKIIQAMGLQRSDVYIANILKCRPDTPGQASGNRKPTPQEMQTCIPYLQEQIDLIQPKVLVALGGTAVEGLVGKTGITKLRGQWDSYRGIPLMPTYHPSYLLRNQALHEKRRVWEDMMQVMERVGLPISEKQRGYFLKR